MKIGCSTAEFPERAPVNQGWDCSIKWGECIRQRKYWDDEKPRENAQREGELPFINSHNCNFEYMNADYDMVSTLHSRMNL